MGQRVDEKILDFINAVEKAKAKKDICSEPVKIGERYYEFEEKAFFDEKVKIYMPKDFEDMPSEERDSKYPSENGPDIIKCNEDGSITFILNIIDRPLDEECIGELKEELKMMIRKTNPANVFYADGVLKVDSKNIGFLEFKSYAIDGSLYNLMFFIEFKGKPLVVTFSCKYTECEEWRDIAIKVIKTVRVIKEDKGDEN